MILNEKNDVFGYWKIEGYDWLKDRRNGFFSEIPFVHSCNIIPDELVLFGNHKKKNNLENAHKKSVHFFEHDYLFNPTIESKKKLTAQLEYFKQYGAVILPDCSVYVNLPLPEQLHQVYKSRSVGVFLEHNGVKIIPCVRWGDEYSYNFCFDGIEKNALIAIGTLSALGTMEDRNYFVKGFIEMVKRIEPKGILVYGHLPDECSYICRKNSIFVKEYLTEFRKYRIEKKENEHQYELFSLNRSND